MEVSILIVSRNRKDDLRETLNRILPLISIEDHEILVYLDNCTDGSQFLVKEFPQILWFDQNKTLGASKARQYLYKRAKGEILIGFDDDASPINRDFIPKTMTIFQMNPEVGIVAYQELRGEINSKSIEASRDLKNDFFTNDFMGCGSAIRRDIYNKTRGFPEWIDIYGEESCLAIETLALGKNILFTYQIAVHHRIDKIRRKNSGRNYFRFRKQLKNTSYFYLVYYPFPLVLRKLLKLYFHNFTKYGLKDADFFRAFLLALFEVSLNTGKVLHYREPKPKELLEKFQGLRIPDYYSNT